MRIKDRPPMLLLFFRDMAVADRLSIIDKILSLYLKILKTVCSFSYKSLFDDPQGGREHWTVNYTCTQSLIKALLAKNFSCFIFFLIGWFKLAVFKVFNK